MIKVLGTFTGHEHVLGTKFDLPEGIEMCLVLPSLIHIIPHLTEVYRTDFPSFYIGNIPVSHAIDKL